LNWNYNDNLFPQDFCDRLYNFTTTEVAKYRIQTDSTGQIQVACYTRNLNTFLQVNNLNSIKMINKIYHAVGIGSKYIRKIIKRGKINASNTHIHDRSLSLFGIITSIKRLQEMVILRQHHQRLEQLTTRYCSCQVTWVGQSSSGKTLWIDTVHMFLSSF